MPGDAALRLLIDITARDSASSIIRALGGVFTGLQGGIKGVMVAGLQLLGLLTLVGAGIAIALGVVAVKAAADFQQGLNRLVTGAGDVTDNMTKMGQAIIGISIATGTATSDLLAAMYQIISANQRGAQAEETLRVAAQGAIAEQAKIVDVAKAVTTVMTDYVKWHLTATQAMNGLTRAVQLGKLSLEELTVSLSPILPNAANVGIAFYGIAAAMSTMTNAGVPAARAATSLRFLMQSLEVPTKKATAAMTAMGLNSIDVGNELKKSLPGALQMIYDAAKRAGPEGSVPFNRAVSDMIGGQRSLQAFLSLTGDHMKTFREDTKAVADAMDASHKAVLGWDTAQSNFNVKLDMAKAAVQAVFIAIGTQLLPILGHLLDKIVPLVQKFADWVTNAKPLSGFLDQVANAIAAVWPPAKTATPVLKTFVDTIQHGHTNMSQFSGSTSDVTKKLPPLTSAVGHGHANMSMLAGSTKAVHQEMNPLIPILQWLKDAFLHVRDAIIAVWNFLVPIAQFIYAGLLPILQKVSLVITTILVPAWNFFVTAIKPYIPTLLLLAEILGGILVAAIIIAAATILLIVGAVLLVIGIFVALVAAILFAANWIHDKIKWLVDVVVGFFKSLWKWLVGGSIIPDIVNGIIMWFGRLKDRLVAIVTAIIKWITDQWNALVKLATSWGQNLINNILAGIQAAWNTLMSWVNGALTALKNLFPQSPVKEGPLKGYENWGYIFGIGIADGIRRSIPAVQSASSMLAAAVGGGYSGSYSMSYGGSGYPTGGSVVVNHITIMPPSIKLDGAEITDKISRRQAKEIRIQGMVRNK